MSTQKVGYVAIVGRPNVGKSTLLNAMLGQKISITSKKRQTTRHNIVGIKTAEQYQMVFVDTPGMHQGQDSAINRYMNRTASSALQDVDLVVFVVDKNHWTGEDEAVALKLTSSNIPIIIALNKCDQLDTLDRLLPHVGALAKKLQGAEIVPVSALKRERLELLEQLILEKLPVSEHLIYPEDQLTDRNMRFIAAEIVREKVIRLSGAELPYQSTVEIEKYDEAADLVTIHALILTEREGQKRILIGERGERIKQIGIDARQDLERLLDCKVMLRIWVKVKSGWSDDERAIRSLGFDESSPR